MTYHNRDRTSADDELYLLTTLEAAELLRVKRKTLYQHVARGDYEGACKKQGKHLVFHRRRLLKLVDHSFDRKGKKR